MRSSKRWGQTASDSGNFVSQTQLTLKPIRRLKHKIQGDIKHLDLFLLALVHLLMAPMRGRRPKTH